MQKPLLNFEKAIKKKLITSQKSTQANLKVEAIIKIKNN